MKMVRGRYFVFVLVLSLLMNVFSYPSASYRTNRALSGDASGQTKEKTANSLTTTQNNDDDDVDSYEFDDSKKSTSSTGGGGSNLFSLLNIANALLPSLSGTNAAKNNLEVIKKLIKEVVKRYQPKTIHKRNDVSDNVIQIDYVSELTPPFFERQESKENVVDVSESSERNSESTEENNSEEVHNSMNTEDNDGEESIENASSDNDNSKSKQDSAAASSNSNDDSDEDDGNDSDYDEPEGDGQGGGILGILAGLSGDGDSDLGSLLAAIGGIVANLSGDGVDINAIIATGLGLFVGLLSDEGTNPGEVIASYLLTSLDTITGGGAENNGQFFGKFLSSLVKGASGGGAGDSSNSSGSSEENGNGGPKMADSAGFFLSLLMGLLGDMSKHSSSSSWR